MIPYYLFDDAAFWVFAIIYTVSIGACTFLITWPLMRLVKPPSVQKYIPKSIAIAFVGMLIFQFFHQAEHVTQMYQFAFLGMSAQEAHGIVWFLDDEWNHFLFNWGYSIGIVAVFIFILRALKKGKVKFHIAHLVFIASFFLLEGWHLVEHTVRITQHVQGICIQCPGIIDTVFDINRLVLHFWFNFFALLLPSAVFVWYDIASMIVKPKTRR